MIAGQWPQRIGYAAMSLFLGWHTIAILLAPVPQNNPIVRSFRAVYQPYLTALGQDTTWDFFSPIGIDHQFRYVILYADGKEHTFVPIADVNWLLPDRRWYERIYTELMNYPSTYGSYFVALFCRKHSSLKPVAITLLDLEEQTFWPEDHLSGRRPYDPDRVTVHPLMRADCPDQS